MKKVLAVILSVLMLVSIAPLAFASGAIDITEDKILETDEADFFSDYFVTVIKSGTFTIPDGMDVVIPAGSTVTVNAGATLEVLGTLEVKKGATLTIKGSILHSERVVVLGTATVDFTFTNVRNSALGNHLQSVDIGYSNDGSSYADVSGNVTWSSNLITGGVVAIPLNSYVYIRTAFKQPAVDGYEETPVTYDDAKLPVLLDNVIAPYVQGAHMATATTSVKVTIGNEKGTWNETDYLYGYSFYVPSGSGYTVHSVTGETSAHGAIKVKAGSDFRFRIEIDGNYDMSKYKIYAYPGYTYDQATGEDHVDTDAVLMVADSDGYYTISNVYSDYTIYVSGVVSNEAIEKTSSILDLLKNVFKVFQSVWVKIAALFGISIGE